jgi:probable HAF family extracellular repeat protein
MRTFMCRSAIFLYLNRNAVSLMIFISVTIPFIGTGRSYAASRETLIDRTRYRLTVLCTDSVPLAEKMNDRGQMIGEGGNWRRRPFAALPGLDQGLDFASFPRPQGCSSVILGGVNNRGEVTGAFVFKVSGAWLSITYDTFIWRKGKITSAAAGFIPHAINDRGEVVGESQDNTPSNENPTHAILWKQGKTIDLGQGGALDINESGVVVGNSGRGNDGTNVPHALLWRN